jgi:tetratricopeptide (TPR) repeat protein
LVLRYSGITLLVLVLLGGGLGCGSRTALPPETPGVAVAPERPGTSDQAKLKEALTGRELPPVEVADLSDRLLADGNPAVTDEETMARLELVLLKTLKGQDKVSRPVLLRNLGVIHYYQKKYKQAQQELQNSNELNPRNARTHFFLARIFVHQEAIYEKKGKKKVARNQLKRATIEMEQAHKLEPSNPLYRQDIKQIIAQESGK